jgi:hypothetical protein
VTGERPQLASHHEETKKAKTTKEKIKMEKLETSLSNPFGKRQQLLSKTKKGTTVNPPTHFKKNPLIAFIAFLFLMGAFTPAYPDVGVVRPLTTPKGDIAFEVVGQVTNPSPTTSNQYGYLSLINGLSAEQIFTTPNPAAQNETTAPFTFFTDAVTERVIANGRLRIINRIGTTTIYFDDPPDGNFANPDSFRDGTPIVVMDHRQQVILDTGDGTFTVVNLLTIVSTKSFEIGGERFRLGKRGDHFRQFYSGAPPTGTPALNGVFAGYAVTIERPKQESE